jgi:hypothetical protein
MRPVFVIGIARSGTNLLARMLDRHPEVCVALDPLMPVFRSLRNAIMRISAPEALRVRFDPDSPFQDFYFDSDGPAALDVLLNGDADLPVDDAEVARLRKAVRERAALESPELGDRLTAISGTRYSDLIRSAFAIIASTKPGAKWVGWKEVWIFDFVPLLARAFPDARIYAIERDPRAIIASLVAMAERDPTQAAHTPSYMRHWRKSIALARIFGSRPEIRGRFGVVSYEALVRDPEAGARRLCVELGLEFQREMLSLSADGWSGNSSFAEGRDVYASSVDRWMSTIPPDARAAADYLCGPEMGLTAYKPQKVEPQQVRAYLEQADAAQVSWKSSSGDSSSDAESEAARHRLLEAPQRPGNQELRRHFLFSETYDAILAARPASTSATRGARTS